MRSKTRDENQARRQTSGAEQSESGEKAGRQTRNHGDEGERRGGGRWRGGQKGGPGGGGGGVGGGGRVERGLHGREGKDEKRAEGGGKRANTKMRHTKGGRRGHKTKPDRAGWRDRPAAGEIELGGGVRAVVGAPRRQ
ncbi:UNVERIFIED_CONTAM: hypothetical protein DV098_10720 [Bifidobacterium breve]|nr:hypothetical protein [Bifidobacterium breve]